MRNEMMESEQLERDAERIRANLAETAVELRARLTPGHAVNQLLNLGSDSTALKFLRNLRDKTVANPLALGIVSVGIAWLIVSSGREASRKHGTLDQARRWILSDDAAESDVMAAEGSGPAVSEALIPKCGKHSQRSDSAKVSGRKLL